MKELKKTTCKKLIKGAKKKTSGPWEGICKGLDSTKCRTSIVYLSEEGEAGLTDVKQQLGKDYTTFIRRYNKEYNRVEREIAEERNKEAEKPPKKKKVVVEEPQVENGLSEEEWAKFNELHKEISVKQSLQALDEYKNLFNNLSPDNKKELIQSLTEEERKMLLELTRELQSLGDEEQSQIHTDVTARKEAKSAVETARDGLAEKIPMAEIEARRHPSDPSVLPWDIDAEVFVPIGVGIATGRIKTITDAVEIFAIIFRGRALPELITIVSTTFIDEYKGKEAKTWNYYTSMVTMLLSVQDIPSVHENAIAATDILEDIMGVTGRAAVFREKVREVIIE